MIGKLVIKLIGPLLKLIFPKIDKKFSDMRQDIIEHIFKVGKIEDSIRYMELPNEADRRIDVIEEKFEKMVKDIHPPQDFPITKDQADELLGFMKKIKNKKKFKMGL